MEHNSSTENTESLQNRMSQERFYLYIIFHIEINIHTVSHLWLWMNTAFIVVYMRCHTWYWSKKLYRCTFCLQLVIISDGAVCFTAEAGCDESHRAQRYGQTPILINLLHCCQTSWTSSFSVPSFVSFCHCWLGLGQFLLFFVVLLLLQVWPSIHGLLTTEGAAEFWKHHDVRLYLYLNWEWRSSERKSKHHWLMSFFGLLQLMNIKPA